MQPEVAHVGLYGSDLEAQNIKYDTFMLPLKDVDRAVLDGETEGQISCMHGHGECPENQQACGLGVQLATCARELQVDWRATCRVMRQCAHTALCLPA